MKGVYRTTFADGSHEDIEAENADAAKTAAKNKRIVEVDPGRRMDKVDLTRHGRVKVAKVVELQPPDAPPADQPPAGSPGYPS